MLKRNQLGKRYLRESDGKITEDDIRDYIYGVAQSTYDNLDFEIDYAITHNHWNDLDLIEDGEVDAEMLSVRIELNDDYAIKYKAIADWVDDIYYTYYFDMYAYVSKDFVLADVNGDPVEEKDYKYEMIEFSFGDAGSIKDVYMNDASTITKEIYTRLEQSLKKKGIYDLVGQPKVELNESRSKTIRSKRKMLESKRLAKRKMLRENKERPTKKDIEEAIYNLAVSLASDLASGSFDKDENTLYKGATVWAKDEVENEYILDWLEYNGFDSINANVSGTYEYKDEYFEIQVGDDGSYHPCHYFMDGEEDYQGFIEDVEELLTEELTRHDDIFELLNDEYYDDFYGESRKCKRVARKSLKESSKRGLSKKALFEKKLTKEFVMGGIEDIADAIVDDMNNDYEGVILSHREEDIDRTYYFDPHYYNIPLARYLSMYKDWIGLAIHWSLKEDKSDFDFSDARIGFGESDYILHDSFNPKSTSKKDIKQEIIDYLKEALVNLGYLDEALVESKSNKRLSKRSLKESKRKSFRGGGYAKKTLKESSSYVLKKSTIREDVNAMIDYCVKSFTEAFEDTDGYGYEYENEDGELEWDWDEFEYEHYLPQWQLAKEPDVVYNTLEKLGLTDIKFYVSPAGSGNAFLNIKFPDKDALIYFYLRKEFEFRQEVKFADLEKHIKEWLNDVLFNQSDIISWVVDFYEEEYDEVTESKKKLKRK